MPNVLVQCCSISKLNGSSSIQTISKVILFQLSWKIRSARNINSVLVAISDIGIETAC